MVIFLLQVSLLRKDILLLGYKQFGVIHKMYWVSRRQRFVDAFMKTVHKWIERGDNIKYFIKALDERDEIMRVIKPRPQSE